jgi:hypothetical protein
MNRNCGRINTVENFLPPNSRFDILFYFVVMNYMTLKYVFKVRVHRPTYLLLQEMCNIKLIILKCVLLVKEAHTWGE